MNLSMNDVRLHLTTWFNWWLGGWQDAWAMLPKPAALQTRPTIFQTTDGVRLSFSATENTPGTWLSMPQASTSNCSPQGVLLPDDDVLLRELNLPPLSERDIAAAVTMDAHIASPFPAGDTHYGYSIRRLPNGQRQIEIALTRKNKLEQLLTQYPQQALFARGQCGAIPLQNDGHNQQTAWYRSPLTLSLSTLLGLVIIAWIISPTLLLRAESMAHEAALAKLNQEAAPLLQKREELNNLKLQIENALAFKNEHPDPLFILEQLSSNIPDSTWVNQLSQRKDQLTFDGTSENAIAIVGLLEKTPCLKDVRLGTSINRDPRSGRETFQILARIHCNAIDVQPSRATP